MGKPPNASTRWPEVIETLKLELVDRRLWLDALLLALPLLVYGWKALKLGDWIMDDAGISFVYSRNLAGGHGLVSQPGRAPVEGYTNPLWVILFTPFFWLNLFDPILTPKFVSFGLVVATTILLYRGALEVLRSRILAALVCWLTLLNTPFVIWTISGMENPLSVFLALLMFWVLAVRRDREGLSLTLGIIAGLAAITRPDGLLYALVLPLHWGIERLHVQKRGPAVWKEYFQDGIRFSIPWLILVGGSFVFRRVYFLAWLPNTYYAKGSGSLSLSAWVEVFTLQRGAVEKLLTLVSGELGKFAALGLGLLLISLAHFLSARRFPARWWAALVLLVPAFMAYLLLPPDWMGEYRFATPVFPFFYLLIIQMVQAWTGYLPAKGWLRQAAALLALCVIFIPGRAQQEGRFNAFANSPATPFLTVAKRYGRTFDDYAAMLEIEDASILLPDMGGTLYYSNLTVYDLGALTDATIARTIRRDQAAFYDYIFEQIQPTFIESYSGFAQFADFDADPRFRRDYVPVRESLDPFLLQSGIRMFSGTYVRREAVTDLSRLEALP